jgi:hypothetical protein
MYQDILRETPSYQYIVDVGREEERQVCLQAQRKLLPIIVQALFPTLVDVAKMQADQINNVEVVEEVIAKVSTARTLEEAHRSLLGWKQASSSD